jgi:hypothetical protein
VKNFAPQISPFYSFRAADIKDIVLSHGMHSFSSSNLFIYFNFFLTALFPYFLDFSLFSLYASILSSYL